MKTKILAIVLAVLLIGMTLCACDNADKAKAAYKPPAELFNINISGTDEPEIDGVEFTYDSQSRIETVNYSIESYEYTQEYTYNNSVQIEIDTIYRTEVIEQKIIRYSDIAVARGFIVVDGYFIRVTDDMPITIEEEYSQPTETPDTDVEVYSEPSEVYDEPEEVYNDQSTVNNLYTNTEYGWSITLPEGWDNVGTVVENTSQYAEGVYGAVGFYEKVDYDNNNSSADNGYVFSIYAVPLNSELDNGYFVNGPTGGYLNSNQAYSFYWTGIRQIPAFKNDPDYTAIQSRYQVVLNMADEIRNSFTLD